MWLPNEVVSEGLYPADEEPDDFPLKAMSSMEVLTAHTICFRALVYASVRI